jgi:biopolymer transport protein ExbD
MEVIAIVETDDGDKSIIVHPRQITLTKLDDQFLAATRCMNSNQPIVCEVDKTVAYMLMQKGVECLDWRE